MSTIPRSKPLAVTGLILYTGPLGGAILTIIAMVRAFGILQVQGTADPSELAAEISLALLSTLYGLAFGLVGLVLVLIALYKNHNREQWFYRNILVLSVIWCFLLFPVGLIPGFIVFFAFYNRRKEFSR